MPSNLIYGDCLEEMKKIPNNSIDLILTDPPYGTTLLKWDSITPFDKLWEQYNRIIKPNGAILIFAQEPFATMLRISNMKDYKYDIYWEKERLTNINQVKRRVGKTIENICVFYKSQCTYNPQMTIYEGKPRTNKVKDGKMGKLTDQQEKKVIEYIDTGFRYPTQVWKYQRDCLKCNLHPTQKPVELLVNLINTFSNEGDTILDSHMGSASTGVACLNTNRKFIGIENNYDIYKIAESRINNRKGDIM